MSAKNKPYKVVSCFSQLTSQKVSSFASLTRKSSTPPLNRSEELQMAERSQNEGKPSADKLPLPFLKTDWRLIVPIHALELVKMLLLKMSAPAAHQVGDVELVADHLAGICIVKFDIAVRKS